MSTFADKEPHEVGLGRLMRECREHGIYTGRGYGGWFWWEDRWGTVFDSPPPDADGPHDSCEAALRDALRKATA